MKSTGQHKGVDLVAGSEKILRVHQRNMVHARYLHNNLNTLEANCKRNLNKVQQEIYNVYYSEFLPLKESKRKIDKQHTGTVTRKGNKKYGLAGEGKVKDKCIFPDINSKTHFGRSLATMSISSSLSDDVFRLPPISDNTRKLDTIERKKQKQTPIPLSVILKLPKEDRSKIMGEWKEDFERCCPSVVSRAEHNLSPNIDKDRLNTIKSAIALSSQPPKITDDLKKNRKLRRSFLINLRRESRVVWNENVLKRTKQSTIPSRNNSAKSIKTKIHTSLARNLICKENAETDDEEHIFEAMSTASKSTIRTFTENVGETTHQNNGQAFHNIPSSDNDDSYYSSTPDFFSGIDEEPSSFADSEYDGYYSTSDTGSSYSGYSDGDFSVTDDER